MVTLRLFILAAFTLVAVSAPLPVRATPEKIAAACGTTLEGQVTLTEDLACDASGLELARGAVLDCAGHTITYGRSRNAGTGHLTRGHVGITVLGSRVAVKNCHLVQGSDGPGGYGFDLFGQDGTFTNNKIITQGSASHGIRLIHGASRNSFIGNTITVHGFDSYGVSIESGSSTNDLLGNHIQAGGGSGRAVRITDSSGNTLKGNTLKVTNADAPVIALGDTRDNIFVNNLMVSGHVGSSELYFYIGVFSQVGQNRWSLAKQEGTNIVGGRYLGGNAWTLQTGTGFSDICRDADGDTICDEDAQLESTRQIDHAALVVGSRTRPAPPPGGDTTTIPPSPGGTTTTPPPPVQLVGPGGCTSADQCVQYSQANPEEWGSFSTHFKGDFNVGFHFVIPPGVREAGLEQEFVGLMCDMSRQAVAISTTSSAAVISHMRRVAQELAISVNMASVERFVQTLQGRADAICTATPDTLESAVQRFISTFQFQPGSDPFGTAGIGKSIADQLAKKFDTAAANALIAEMTAAYARGDTARGNTLRAQVEALQQKAVQLQEKIRRLLDPAVFEQITVTAQRSAAEFQVSFSKKMCEFGDKLIGYRVERLRKEIRNLESLGLRSTTLAEVLTFLESVRTRVKSCPDPKTIQALTQETETRMRNLEAQVERELDAQITSQYFGEMAKQGSSMAAGLAEAKQWQVSPDKIARLERAIAALEVLQRQRNSGQRVPLTELRLAALELNEAYKSALAETDVQIVSHHFGEVAKQRSSVAAALAEAKQRQVSPDKIARLERAIAALEVLERQRGSGQRVLFTEFRQAALEFNEAYKNVLAEAQERRR